MLEQARRQGLSDAQLLAAYPTLRPADLVNAWTYVPAHEAEIGRMIIENEAA